MKFFPPFRLDPVNQCLWRDGESDRAERVTLSPKAYAILLLLVDHAGRLVTHEELLRAVWPDTFVQPEVLSRHVRDIRRVLGDSPKASSFIETLPKRGYRFIAPLAADPRGGEAGPASEDSRLVGRELPLDGLNEALRRMVAGERQVLFVTGELGIGKTALVEEFRRLAGRAVPNLQISRGQCIEGYGGKEAYYPVLEALGQLFRGPSGDALVRIVAEYAPTWLVQFPALVRQPHRQMLQREILGATRDRMVREFGEALERFAAVNPVLLILEDLQWADRSTVDLIAAVARRRSPARLMLIATSRALGLTSEDPFQALRRELVVHRLGREVELEPLSQGGVARFLAADPADDLARMVHRHSGGNPLFMVTILDHLFRRGVLSRPEGRWKLEVPLETLDDDIPETLRQIIEAQVGQLSRVERQVLEIASLSASTQFVIADVAAASDLEEIEFEEICAGLARRGRMIRSTGPHRFPDGGASHRYEFRHVLYRDVFYHRQAAGRRAVSHLRIGDGMEVRYAGRLNEVSAELAHHFSSGSDWLRAVNHLRISAETAERRLAHRDAAAVLERALELLGFLPGPDRMLHEIPILEKLGTAYRAASDRRAVEAYEMLAERAVRHGLLEIEARILADIAFPVSRASLDRYLDIIERTLVEGERLENPRLRTRTRASCHFLRIWAKGWNAVDAAAFETAFAEIRATERPLLLAPYLILRGALQCVTSRYREAHRATVESFTILFETEVRNPFIGIALQKNWLFLVWSLIFAGEWGQAQREIESALRMMEENGDFARAQAFRLCQAWFHLEALDFEGVLEICEAVTLSLGNPAGIYPVRFPLALAGLAEREFGNFETALDHLLTARADMERQKTVFDWYWAVIIESALAEIRLAQGDLAGAVGQAERFLDLAMASPERTWQARALETGVRVALANDDREHAESLLRRAFEVMEGYETPLAEWRVHAAAAEFHRVTGNPERHVFHRQAARAGIFRLAESLPEESRLRRIFLSRLKNLVE